MASIEPGQFQQLFSAHGPALVLYASQWLEAGLAEDVVQEVFLRLISQRRGPQCWKAWLFVSVRNAAINQLRSLKRRRKHEGRLAERRPNWFEARPEDQLDAQQAQETLSALPQEQREVIVLRIWAGMTLREVADVVGQPISTVFSRYQAGLGAMRRKMEQSCRTTND